MTPRPVAAVGVAITTFLVVAVALIEALSTQIGFPVFVALPGGLAAGFAAATVVWLRLWHVPRARAPLLGVAAFGYAMFVAAAVAYSVPPARGAVTPTTGVVFGVVCAVAVALLGRRSPERFDL